jgi:hypothetical protein
MEGAIAAPIAHTYFFEVLHVYRLEDFDLIGLYFSIVDSRCRGVLNLKTRFLYICLSVVPLPRRFRSHVVVHQAAGGSR